MFHFLRDLKVSICEAGHPGNLLDVAVDGLVLEVRHLVVVFLQNGQQLLLAGNADFGAGLLLVDIDVGDFLRFDDGLGLVIVTFVYPDTLHWGGLDNEGGAEPRTAYTKSGDYLFFPGENSQPHQVWL